MRYDADVSIQQVNSDSSVALAAVDDRDSVGAGSSGPATGNLITDVEGDGGRDSVGASAVTVTRVASLNGGSSDDSGEDGSLQVNGQFGTLTVNIDGSYSYTRNADSPCGVEEIFAYTITDADGNESIARLIIRIEPSTLETRCLAEVARIVPGPDGIIVLPPGVDLEDVQVQGRDLVITMPDGTQWVIVDGAVFVPQLVINNIQIPPSNLTALLIGREVQPAAGPPQSSGGNFEVDPGNLDPGFELGDLLPPTELVFTPPTFGEVYQPLPQDEPPEVIIVTPDNPVGAVNATDEVDEAGLPARGTEPAGSQSATSVETTTGTIVIVSGDQPVTTTISGVSINGVAVTAIGQTFVTPLGTLTVTSISPTQIGYSYTLTDNTSGDSTHDDFSVQITDADGDTASATLRIDIIDDVPTARNDTDVVTASEAGTDGNVFTGAGTTSLAAGADTPGADNAVVSGFRAGSTGGFTAVGTGTTIVGQYGTLVVNANGSYVYTRDPGSPGGVTDVFTYELTDGDGDTSTARLDISIVDSAPVTGQNAIALLDDDALAGGNPGGVGDDPDAAALTGTLSASGGDGGLTFAFATSGAPTGFTYENQGDDLLVRQDGRLVLTITLDASTGAYTVVQNAPIAHSAGGDENNQGFSLTYTATDADGDAASGVLQIDVDDDTPDAPSVTLASTEPIAVTYEGALSGGNFVGPEESADSNVSPLVSQVDFSQGFVLGNLADYGADGPGATVVAYTLNFAAGFAEGGLSGLSSSGQPVYLYQGAGGVVIGSTATAEGDISGANTVFTIAVDAETGVLTVTQSQPVDHGDSDAYDGAYQDDLTSFGANILELEVSAYTTDSDGDRSATARGVIDLAGNIRFGDDGPTVDVTVTEEDPVLLVTQDAETIGDASDSASTTVDFAGVFARTFTSGADSPASAVWSYALAITGAADEAGLVDSGLDAGPTGANIYLYQLADGTIVGSTATTAPATIDDTVVFSIGVSDAGAVTLTQYSEIHHELEAGANDAPFDDQLAILDSGLVQLIGSSTVTDSDGDTATDSAFIDLGGNIRFADDGPVSSTGTYAVGEVHEDALANPAATGNLEAGETQVVTATVSAASLAALVADGADSPVTIALNNLGGADSIEGTSTGLTQLGVAITWHVVSATQIDGIIGGDTSKVAFSLTKNGGDDDFTFTLKDNIDHGTLIDDNGDAYVEGLSLSNLFKATDTDGDVVVIGAAVSIDIENDVPLEFTTPPTAAVGTNSTTPFSLLNISLNEPSVGADSPGTTTFDVVDGTAIFDATNNALTTNTGAALSWNVVSPSVIQGVTADNFVAFQIELNGDGTYDYLQYTQLATLSERDITNLSSVGGGNVPAKGIDVPGTPFDLLLSTRDGETVNTNATAIGVGAGQSMSGNDVIRVDFLQDVFVTGSGGGAVLNWGEYYAANSYRQDVSGLAGTQNADFVVRVVVADPIVAGVDADGDSIFYGDTNDDYVSPTLTTIAIYDAAGVLVVNPALQGILITQTTDGWQILNLPNLYDFKVTSETPFNAVEIESLLTSDTFKLGQIKLAAFAAQDVTFNAPIDYTDTDGDSVDSMITVDLSAPPPVVLDLDGDGQIAFLSQEAGVAFDYEGDGILEQTAWVGSSDGLLVRDANGDGIVNDGREIVFGTGGQTDLEGLAARHDSNGDGQLTEADAAYASFGVWQDANTNGVSEPGELRSLSELGIVSIDLTGTGQPYLAADGDVLVSGESSFTRSDGSTGLVADVSFTTSARQVQEAQKAETLSGQSLTNALVAASLVASIGAVVGGDEAGAGQALSQEQPVAASNGVDAPAAAPLAVGPENSSSLLSSPAFEAKAPEAMSMRADPVADPAQAALDGRPAGGEQLPAPSDLLADTILTLPQPIMPGAPSVDGSAAIFMVGGADAAAGLVPSAALGAVLADALPPEATGPDIEALLDVLGAAPNESRLPDGLAPAGGGQGGTAGDLTFFTADAGFAIQQFLESAMASQEVAAAAQS